jgi:hypothetical protein
MDPSSVSAPRAVKKLHIEFGGVQLTVASDDAEVLEYFRRNYGMMLVSRVTKSAGELSVFRSETGYDIQATSSIQHPATGLELLFAFLRREILVFFIRARPDLLWLHAGAVERDGSAVLVCGGSGRGKSSIVTRLCDLGWKLLSDENSPIDMRTNEVHPFPQLPRHRVNPGYEVDAGAFGGLEVEEISVDATVVRRAPTPILAIVFPAFRAGTEAVLNRLSSGPAVMEIIRNAQNFSDHKAAAVSHAVEMGKGIGCYGLAYNDAAEAARLIDSALLTLPS